ncbi:MAG: squalene synthase [candidate division Zixibacteria bacterium CG_4_9_14_3_um_filter_46_8]|nr:MAG: squalene synthase [candidate division Zixibacteria bacterium CG_4_9_14_3_um_filter_46_8]
MIIDNPSLSSHYILSQVSRSFAKSIPMLDRNKKDEVENQYLLLRFMDTIEDSKNHSLAYKRALMDKFFHLLISKSNAHYNELVTEVSKDAIDDHDRVLIDNLEGVVSKFKSFEEPVKNISLECLTEMGEGMLLFQSTRSHSSGGPHQYCRTFHDLNRYCYYVAGTVGKYLTKLVEIKDGIELDIQKALNFGRYLQKVNIIKDFQKDLDEFRYYWPTDLNPDLNPMRLITDPDSRGQRLKMLERMIADAMQEFGPTFDYILSIPKRKGLRGYLAFCLMAAIMATETLLKMWNNEDVFLNRKGVKISKLRFYQIYVFSKFGLYSDDSLHQYIQRVTALPLPI